MSENSKSNANDRKPESKHYSRPLLVKISLIWTVWARHYYDVTIYKDGLQASNNNQLEMAMLLWWWWFWPNKEERILITGKYTS